MLWKKSLNESFSPLSIDSDRVIGIQVQTACDKYTYVLLQVYYAQLKSQYSILPSTHRTVT